MVRHSAKIELRRETALSNLAARDLLVSAIQDGRPVILVLGQDAHSADGAEDPVLAAALKRRGARGSAKSDWTALLAETGVQQPVFYEWLAERFKRRVLPPWLSALTDVPWSAVFTSTIDPSVTGLVEGQGREPELILAANETPRAVRSMSRPPVYCLFGLAGLQDADSRPPINRTELNTRRINHAIPMLNRILDTATTIGVVVVDGILSGRDWLKTDDVLGTFGRAAPDQILWFGEPPESGTDERADFDAAVDSGRIVAEYGRLGTALSELLAVGRLEALETPDSQEAGQISFDNDQALELSPEERLRVEAASSIVDDAWTAFLAPQGPDTEYDSFRRFHGDLGGPRLLVEGVRRGFAITRRYEQRLLHVVREAVADHASVDEPVVVHGQSGTGKSIALARVVARIRESKAGAVLYSVGRIPQAEQITGFCEDAERAGAQATLVVCDANEEVDRYRDLLVSMRSGGRRVVVVGSRYRMAEDDAGNGKQNIEAPSELGPEERTDLTELLNRFGSEGVSPTVFQDIHMLALLYRLLPASRGRIAAGLSDEAWVTEQALRGRGKTVQSVPPKTLMATKFIEAGLTAPKGVWSEDELEGTLEYRDAPGRLIDLVMVCGNLNCHVPVNLLMRTVTENFPGTDIGFIADMFRNLDLFRWDWADEEHSELLVGPRLTLEAELICDRRLGSPSSEAERLLEIIGAVRAGIDASQELGFLLNLLNRVGEEGPRGSRYLDSYVDVGRALTNLRTRFGVTHASLMLQESAFRRAAVRRRAVEDKERLPLLEEARDALQVAIDGVDSGTIRAGRRTRQNLLVERASLYGFLAYDCAERDSADEDVWSSYMAARVAIRQAVSVTDTYYPLDVGLWTPADLLEVADLSDTQRAEITADIYSTLDQVDSEALPPKQQEKFQVRQMKLGSVLGNEELAEEAYVRLQEVGSTAGYFLRARAMAPALARDTVALASATDVSKAERAATFLHSHLVKIKADERCLALLFECRWIAAMRHRPFQGRRQPIPDDGTTRRELLRILRVLNGSARDSARHVTRYLEAVLLWVTGAEREARRIFTELGRETEFEDWGRVVRRHRIADSQGNPQVFSGRILRKRSEGHWLIRLDGLNKIVTLLERDFREHDIADGRHIRGFGVAFNYIGPIADPLERRR